MRSHRRFVSLAFACCAGVAAATDFPVISGLTNNSNGSNYAPSISGDGQSVAWVDSETHATWGAYKRIVLLKRGSSPIDLTTLSDLDSVSIPNVSRDGKSVVFYAHHRVSSGPYEIYSSAYHVDISGSTPVITKSPFSENIPDASTIAWSPVVSDLTEGQTVLACSYNKSSGNILDPSIGRQIYTWTLGAAASTIAAVSRYSGVPADTECLQPVINGPATRIAFVSSATNLGPSTSLQRVFQIGRSTIASSWGNPVVASSSTYPCHSPAMDRAGRRLAYVEQRGTKTCDVKLRDSVWGWNDYPYSITTPGLNLPRVASINETSRPALSPDGRVLGFYSSRRFNDPWFDILDDYTLIPPGYDGPSEGYEVGLGDITWSLFTQELPAYTSTLPEGPIADLPTIQSYSLEAGPVRHARQAYPRASISDKYATPANQRALVFSSGADRILDRTSSSWPATNTFWVYLREVF
ncbi:hypothetical protein EON81_07250 [bacterium]|nr:MAG: hypothetical protein EON81_07250 [bacterium]